MKSRVSLVLVVISLLCIAAWRGQSQTDKARSVSYEYQVLADPTETAGTDEGLKRLNDLGAQGWELAAVSRRGNAASKLYFKRARRSL